MAAAALLSLPVRATAAAQLLEAAPRSSAMSPACGERGNAAELRAPPRGVAFSSWSASVAIAAWRVSTFDGYRRCTIWLPAFGVLTEDKRRCGSSCRRDTAVSGGAATVAGWRHHFLGPSTIGVRHGLGPMGVSLPDMRPVRRSSGCCSKSCSSVPSSTGPAARTVRVCWPIVTESSCGRCTWRILGSNA